MRGPRIPIRLNRSALPGVLHRLLPNAEDPRPLLHPGALSPADFSRCVSSIRIGHTWKTTTAQRQPASDAQLLGLATPASVVLEVGASDGINALDLIRRLGANFARYIVTDAYQKVCIFHRKGRTYLYYGDVSKPIMVITDRWIAYHDDAHALFPMNYLVRWIFHQAPPQPNQDTQEIVLTQPTLLDIAREDPRVSLSPWDVTQPWDGEKADIIKLANVLNRHYFHDQQIKLAVGHCVKALSDGGVLMLVENRAVEQWSLFRKVGASLVLEREGQPGSEIAGLILDPGG